MRRNVRFLPGVRIPGGTKAERQPTLDMSTNRPDGTTTLMHTTNISRSEKGASKLRLLRLCVATSGFCRGFESPAARRPNKNLHLTSQHFGRTVRPHLCTPTTYAQDKADEDQVQWAQLGQPNEATTGKLERYTGSCEPMSMPTDKSWTADKSSKTHAGPPGGHT